jgi:Zn-finger nucleic acid-binding protein
MQCPACKVSLRHHKHTSIEFDICPQCRGIHVAGHQLHALAVNVAADGQVRSDAKLTFKPRTVLRPLPDKNLARMCPECGQAMKEFNYAYDSNVFLDRCDRCRGIWLDPNEIIDIAKHIQYNPDVDAVARSIIKKDETSENDDAFIYAIAVLIVTILRVLIFRH